MTHRYALKYCQNWGRSEAPGSVGTTPVLRTRRQSVYRRHDLNTGFGMERENLVLDVKENDEWQTP